jgi:hypothetical protein
MPQMQAPLVTAAYNAIVACGQRQPPCQALERDARAARDSQNGDAAMKKTFALAAAAALALAAGAAHADRGVSWSVGIGLPGVTTVIGNAPQVAYAPPPAYYAPAPAYYGPPQAYYAPVPQVAYGPPRGYYRPRPVYAPALVVPPVARVVVPYRHRGWAPGPVAYAPPAVYAPGPVMFAGPRHHWRYGY